MNVPPACTGNRGGFIKKRMSKEGILIDIETDERRTSNVQHRTSNECILSVLKKISRHAAQAPALRVAPSIKSLLGSVFEPLITIKNSFALDDTPQLAAWGSLMILYIHFSRGLSMGEPRFKLFIKSVDNQIEVAFKL